LLFQHFPEGEKLQENSRRMDSLCTQNWTQEFQKDWHCLDHDIPWRQLTSGSEITTHHSHKYNYNDIHQNKRTFWFNLQQISTWYNTRTSQTAYRELIPFIFLCFSASSMHNILEMSTNTRTFLDGQAKHRVKSINGLH
jgi:hypothetical protein